MSDLDPERLEAAVIAFHESRANEYPEYEGPVAAAIRAYVAGGEVVAYSAEERARRRAGPASVKWPMPDPLAKYREPVAAQPAQSREGVAQCCMCGKKGLSTVEGDGGPECELEDGRWVCSSKCYDAALSQAPAPEGWVPTEDQIEHMVRRFLAWRLPDDFNPDGGISFEREYNQNTPWPAKHEPVGTNLLTYTQAEAMVRHMLAARPAPPKEG